MFRVLFRVIKICIHIKEQLQLQVQLKKGDQMLLDNRIYPLLNGTSHVDLTKQFFICSSNPTFELHVNFSFQKIKKSAGYVTINLLDWKRGNSHLEIRTLQKSPGGKAIIQFGFIYFDSKINYMQRSLMGFQEFEKLSNKQIRLQIEQQNFSLTQKLKTLNQQKLQLSERQEIYNKLEGELLKFQTFFDNSISVREQEMQESEADLKEEQKKTQYLMNLIRNSNSETLKNSLQNFEIMEAETDDVSNMSN